MSKNHWSIMWKIYKKIFFLCMIFLINLHSSPDNKKAVITSCFGAGFFAEFRRILHGIMDITLNGTEGKEVQVDWSADFFPYRNNTGNGWDLFFDPVGYVENKRNISTVHLMHDQTCLNKWLLYDDFYCYRLRINQIINKYIKINKNILDEVDAYYAAYMKNVIRIGVHVRFSAAHGCEKPGALKLKDYFDEIDVLRKKIHKIGKKYVIYLATDSNYVIQEFKKRYKHVLYGDAIRSMYMEEVHLIADKPEYWLTHVEEFHEKKPGYKGGKDVLVDCLLLACCDYLIHTTSNVADFATFFNPQLQSILVPKTIAPHKKMGCAACDVPEKWYLYHDFN